MNTPKFFGRLAPISYVAATGMHGMAGTGLSARRQEASADANGIGSYSEGISNRMDGRCTFTNSPQPRLLSDSHPLQLWQALARPRLVLRDVKEALQKQQDNQLIFSELFSSPL